MFNLDQAIANWRQQMMASGIKTPALLDELESHLREDVEEQVQSRSSEQQAFEAAVRRIGQAGLLQDEFLKLGGTQEARQAKFMRLGCFIPATFFVLVGARHFLTQEMSSGEQLLGFTTVALVATYLYSLPYSFQFLPAVNSRRARMAIQSAGMFAWLVCGVIILANLAPAEMAVVLWAMMSIVAVLAWIPCIVAYDSGVPPAPGGRLPLPPGDGGPSQPGPACPIPGPRPFPPEVGKLFRLLGWLNSRQRAPL